jgi:hypothetical protein
MKTMYATIEIECSKAAIVGVGALWLYQTRSIDLVRYHYKHITGATTKRIKLPRYCPFISLHFLETERSSIAELLRSGHHVQQPFSLALLPFVHSDSV